MTELSSTALGLALPLDFPLAGNTHGLTDAVPMDSPCCSCKANYNGAL